MSGLEVTAHVLAHNMVLGCRLKTLGTASSYADWANVTQVVWRHVVFVMRCLAFFQMASFLCLKRGSMDEKIMSWFSAVHVLCATHIK